MLINLDLLLRAHLGFTEQERRTKQLFGITFRLHGPVCENSSSNPRHATELSDTMAATGNFFSVLNTLFEHQRFTTIERLAAVASDIAQEHYVRNPITPLGIHDVDVIVRKPHAYQRELHSGERPVRCVEFRYFDKEIDGAHCDCNDLPSLSLRGVKLPADIISGLTPGKLTLDLTVTYPHEPIACYTDDRDHVYLDHRELHMLVRQAVILAPKKRISVKSFADKLATSVLQRAPVQGVQLDFRVYHEEGRPAYRPSVEPDSAGNVLAFRLLPEFHLTKSREQEGLPVLFDRGYVAKADITSGRISFMPPSQYVEVVTGGV
ncbi:TPA: dihydroneopterin aldolase [Candidatus Woesearchaeota archaeon]|nr:dihydroneopterin aldolase [Candidatus Woesearchaeota archaeon]HII89220.1 dihydroneopterin aldolase [Candidatus Woesearchaeota archaeon]